MEVYALLFGQIANTTITITFPSSITGNAAGVTLHPAPPAPSPLTDTRTAILRTCKAISAEALEVLYAKNLFIIKTRLGYAALPWLAQPQSSLMQHIRHLELYVSLNGRTGSVGPEIRAIVKKLEGGAGLKTLDLVMDAVTEPRWATDVVADVFANFRVSGRVNVRIPRGAVEEGCGISEDCRLSLQQRIVSGRQTRMSWREEKAESVFRRLRKHLLHVLSF